MPDLEFIHSTADVTSTLLYAIDSGFQVRLDEPQPEPQPRWLSATDAAKASRGVYMFYQADWIYGPFQSVAISSGYNEGKYSISPNVNCSPISVYFSGERMEGGARRLGCATLSYNDDWLEMPAKAIKATPADVRTWCKRIADYMSTAIIVKAGVHRYRVCRGVIADPDVLKCLPPFDYVPWGLTVLGLS